MRQGQQNRRGRGRSSNRKGGGHHNPLSRSFESNGPDVKIRGTPAHIAEKYIALARDAQSSGDPVLAENYLQHAEHYSRIIMAYRDQVNQPGDGLNGNGQRMRGQGEAGEGTEEFGEDDGEDGGEDIFPQPTVPSVQTQGHQQQRQHGGGDHNRHDRPFRRDQGRNRERYNDRGDRERQGYDRDRNQEARPQQQDHRPQQQDRPPPPDRPPPQDQQGEKRERFQSQPQHEQPEFLRRPVRRARPENGESGKDEPPRE